ncbi:MAG TPA: hypothetical protein VIO83_09465 [Pseudomonas sp.]
MNLIEKTNHLGIAIEYVEFESVPVQQVQTVSREIQQHVAAINARQAVSQAKAAAAYAEGARS